MHPTITTELARMRADDIARSAQRHRPEIPAGRRARRLRTPARFRTLRAQLSHV